MRVFLDANILIDHVDATRPDHADSTRIVLGMEDGSTEPVITGLSICTMVYVLKRAGFASEKLLRYVSVLIGNCDIASTDLMQIQGAVNSGWSDFEDAVQYQAALSAGRVQAIITSDTKGFKASRIPIYTPSEFVREHM